MSLIFLDSFARCLPAVDAVTPENEDQKKGVDIVKYALTRPLYTIADNAGLDASVVVNNVKQCANVNEGFDAANEKMVDMIATGIIDPAKVVRTALTDAAGVASLLCTAEVSVSLPFIICTPNIITTKNICRPSSRRFRRRSPRCLQAAAWVAWAVWEEWEA